MKVVVQKSKNASVTINGKIYNEIPSGLVILVGFTEGDSLEQIRYMAKKIANLRIFEDENDIMNKSILDVGGEVLSISQFTLYGDASKGNRPSYIKALNGEVATELYDEFNKELNQYITVKTGIFGADMKVFITNDGPITIILESRV